MGTFVRETKKPSRCRDKAYAVLLGLTGAGKSSTVDFLFPGAIQGETGFASATQAIIEYAISVPTPEEKSKTSTFVIVDTPGFGDTREQGRDSRFLATFESYISNHQDLRLCFPNVVLLAIQYHDDKIQGETSRFIQMLRGLESLISKGLLIDRNTGSCNLIVVLTHTMSEADELKRRDPTAKAKLVNNLIKAFTSIPTPVKVVMVENKPELYGIEQRNDYYELPNGEFYPFNLFQAIQRMAERCDDLLAETIFYEAFRLPKKLTKVKALEKTLFDSEDPSVLSYKGLLQNAKFNIKESQMSSELEQLWNSLPEPFQTQERNSLPLFKKAFQDFGITSRANIPNGKQEIRDLIAELPINEGVKMMLNKLGIRAPYLPVERLGIGWFYNFFSDTLGPTCPFDLSSDFTTSSVGFMAPSCIQGIPVDETKNTSAGHRDMSQYALARSQNLNIPSDFSPDIIQPNVMKPGHNITGVSETNVSVLLEFRKFEIILGSGAELTKEYANSLQVLPRVKKLAKDKQALRLWTAFFNRTGTHFVRRAFAGGALEVRAQRDKNKPEANTAVEVLTRLNGLLNTLFAPITENVQQEFADWNFTVKLHGGDANIMGPTIENLFTEDGRQILNSWNNSLALHPVMLDSDIQLEGIVYRVQTFNPVMADFLESSIAAVYHGGKKDKRGKGPEGRKYVVKRNWRQSPCKMT